MRRVTMKSDINLFQLTYNKFANTTRSPEFMSIAIQLRSIEEIIHSAIIRGDHLETNIK